MGYRVEVRDKDLKRIGVIDTWISLDFNVELSNQGSWQLLIKAGTPQAELLQQGGGIAIYQDGVPRPLLTGAIESFQKYWTVEQHTAEGSVYVGGKTDNKLAYQRLAFPDPALDIPHQYSSTVDSRAISKPAGSAVWDELALSMGPSAVADRRVNGLVVGTKPTFGDTVVDTLRYDVIGEKLADWCSTKGIGYQFLWDPDTRKINLDVFTPTDKSKQIRFSPELGNLREYTWTLTAPTVTRVIVACQGEGKDRYIWQKINAGIEAEWALKIEAFSDRRDVPLKTGTSGSPELVAVKDEDGIEDIGVNPETEAEWTTTLTAARAAYEASQTTANKNALIAAITAAKPVAVAYWITVVEEAADAALKEGEESGNFQIYPIDTEQMQFGRDYFVGDIVSVEVDGTTYVDKVRSVTITVDDGGNALSVAPVIGEQGTDNPLNLYKTIFEMRKKLRKLEARV